MRRISTVPREAFRSVSVNPPASRVATCRSSGFLWKQRMSCNNAMQSKEEVGEVLRRLGEDRPGRHRSSPNRPLW
jgi:hypothetical protein